MKTDLSNNTHKTNPKSKKKQEIRKNNDIKTQKLVIILGDSMAYYWYKHVNPNKAGFFEGSFFWGGLNLTPSSYFKKNLSNINITLYNC